MSTPVVDVALVPKAGLSALRKPFPPHQVSKLPKGGLLLDYVGHAALTDRLLDADPEWNWEPLALDASGLPALDANGGLWIRLTVCGLTRLGYGHAGAKKGGDAIKELIGDALRNAAMRFGAALDLWHKGDLHAHEASETPEAEPQPAAPTPDGYDSWLLDIEAAADEGTGALRKAWQESEKPFTLYLANTDKARIELLRDRAKQADAVPA